VWENPPPGISLLLPLFKCRAGSGKKKCRYGTLFLFLPSFPSAFPSFPFHPFLSSPFLSLLSFASLPCAGALLQEPAWESGNQCELFHWVRGGVKTVLMHSELTIPLLLIGLEHLHALSIVIHSVPATYRCVVFLSNVWYGFESAKGTTGMATGELSAKCLRPK